MASVKQKTLNYLKRTKWYHGTTLYNWKKICSLGVQANYNIGFETDFGYGFYLTPDKEQAEYYIRNLLKYNLEDHITNIPMKKEQDKKIPVIIEFYFYPWVLYDEKKYSFGFFDKYDDRFAKFVFNNRVYNLDGSQQHNFDIIFGVMSDNVPTILIQEYKNNEKSYNEVILALKKSTRNKQLSLHKQEICDTLKPVRVYSLDSGKELNVDDYYS